MKPFLQDLHATVNGALVLGATTGGHHHTSPNSINRVRHQTSSNSHTPAEEERKTNIATITNKDGLQSLHIDINETIELALTSLALGIISQPGSGVVKGVDEEKGHGTSSATASNVGCKLGGRAGSLGGCKDSLDGILESKVKSLGREVSEHVGQVSSPEGVDTLSLQHSGGAVNDTCVWLVKSALLDHLILVLDEELDSLNGGGGGLGHTGGYTSQHEVLNKSEFLFISHFDKIYPGPAGKL